MHQTFSPHIITMNPQFPEHEHLNCPRCDSSNTKFCYYNNYNLSQPRHFCKNCRRYWTKGGTLRNIPVGGGTRKTAKRSSTSNKRPADSDSPTTPSPSPPPPPPPPPPLAESKAETKTKTKTETETSEIFGYRSDQMKLDGESFESMLKSNQRVEFGSSADGLRPNLCGGSEEDGVTRTPANTGVLRKQYLSLNGDDNESCGSGGREESNGGGNRWPNLSIFTPGSNLH